MDGALQTMIDNLQKNTGKSLDAWIEIIKLQALEKHGEIVAYLKGTHGFTHGFANMVAHKHKEAMLEKPLEDSELIAQQYAGKEHFKPLYDTLLKSILAFGGDVEIAPKKTYVSMRRKKQFAILNPATKSRFEVGVNLKGMDPQGVLEAEKPGAMCSHKINIASASEPLDEVLRWLKKAYDNAG